MITIKNRLNKTLHFRLDSPIPVRGAKPVKTDAGYKVKKEFTLTMLPFESRSLPANIIHNPTVINGLKKREIKQARDNKPKVVTPPEPDHSIAAIPEQVPEPTLYSEPEPEPELDPAAAPEPEPDPAPATGSKKKKRR